MDCPTKLYYATNPGYRSTLDDNDFLEALAKGGIQVGELAKLYYPGGTDIETLNKDEALKQTNELLKRDNAIIYEAAIQYDQCFIRVDVLVKEGKTMNLYEVKSKSWGSDDNFHLQNGTIKQIKTFDRDYNPEDNIVIASIEF